MKKILLLFGTLGITVINVQAQTQIKAKFNEDSATTNSVSREVFKKALVPTSNSLIGANENGLNTDFTTSFNNDESTVGFKLAIPIFKNEEKLNGVLTSEIEIGNSSNFIGLGDIDMPIWKLKLNYHVLLKDKVFNIKGKPSDTSYARYHWFTGGVNYINKEYQIFDITRPLANQIYSERYNNFELNVGYNNYRNWTSIWRRMYTRPSFLYFTANYSLTEGNNVEKFEQVEIQEVEVINDTNQNRILVRNSKKAFSGSYKEFMQHSFSGEVLIGIKDLFIIDLFGDAQLGGENDPLYSFGFGTYLLINDSDKKNKVTLGVFVKRVGDDQPYLGFKTSLPITL